MRNINFWLLYAAGFCVLFVAPQLLATAVMGPMWMGHYGGYVAFVSALFASVLSDFMSKAAMNRIKK